MSKILTVLKKELRRFFTDKRMLISIFLPGVLIFTIYSLMGNVVTDLMNQEMTDFTVYVENEPDGFDMIYKAENWNLTINPEELSKDEIMAKVREGNVDLYIIYEEDFMDKINASNGSIPNIEIYYNSTVDSSVYLYTYAIAVLDTIESQMANKYDINLGITPDLATEEDMSIKIIGMILPFILITFLISGAMGICSESIAGEKERGTIATLLVTPIKRSHLAIGKVMALGITTLVSAFVSFMGLILSLPKLVGTELSVGAYDFSQILALFGVVVVTALFFTTILTIVSTYSKSVKEANSLAGPLMILVMITGVSNIMSTEASNNLLLYLIPVNNSVQSLTGILNQSYDIWAIIITILSNAIYIGLGVFVLTKMFNSEKMMFNK